MTYKFGTMLSFKYGKKQKPGQVGGWKNDPKPKLLVFYDDGSHYIEGINTNYLSKWYIKRLKYLMRLFPGVDGIKFYNVVKKTAWYAVRHGYRKYIRSSLKNAKLTEKRVTKRSEMKKVNESFKVHYPSLKKVTKMGYTDPRNDDDLKKSIGFQKQGKFDQAGVLLDGTYIMYEDNGFVIGVHISDVVDEETGDSVINVIAMDKDKNKVKNRMGYRMRRCKNM